MKKLILSLMVIVGMGFAASGAFASGGALGGSNFELCKIGAINCGYSREKMPMPQPTKSAPAHNDA